MREQEMWRIVRRVLSRAARQVVIPASLGLGVALGGCGDRAVPTDAGSADVEAMDIGSGMRYAAVFPDAAFPDAAFPDGLSYPKYAAPLYAAPIPEPDYAAPFPEPEPESDAG